MMRSVMTSRARGVAETATTRATSGDDATTTTTTHAERGGLGGGPVTTSDVHVLVVDDERICRTVTSSLLKRCGYRVTMASSGEEALELLRRGTEFHLLLTDVMMPGVDGPALLQIVRNDERLRDMPVVMMSANEHSETVFRCIQYGAEDYLLKPVSRKAVMHMWQHVWRKSHAQTARAVPRFENGEEVLDDEEDHRGELAHGVPAVPEHTGFTGAPTDSVDDAGTSEDKPPLSPPPRMIRNNSTQSIVETAASGGKMGDAGTYALSACDNLSQGSVIAIRADAVAMRDAADAARRSTPEPARARPLPPPLVGLENGSRGLKEWLDDVVAGAQAVSKEERWHVGWRILAFLDDVASRGRASYESFDASCLDISPQGAISFSARANVSSKTEDGENPFVELAQELDDHDSRFVVGLVVLNMFWPEVFITVYEAEYPQEALKNVISMTGFAERAMTAEIDAAKVVVSLLGRENRVDVKEASERLRQIAGEARSQGVETERRIETLKNLENVLETLRTARGSQLLELSHSRGMLDMLLAQAGISVAHTSASPDESSVRKRARVNETGGVQIPQLCDGITCYDDKTLKEEGVDAVVRSAFNSARSLEADVFRDLEGHLFQKCLKATKQNTAKDDSDASWLKRLREDGSGTTPSLRAVLDDFEGDVCLATRSVSLKSRAVVGGDVGDFVANNVMVCSTSWDRDGEFFATAGTNKSICIYEVDAVMNMGARVHCPAVEFEAHAKISSLCHNPYVKQSIASGDYQGVVQLWDVQKEMSTWENNTHRRRVWSIDYSRVDPTKLASASDDGTVQVYSTLTKTATYAIQNRANVCSVKFHPESAHLLSIGSADHNVHCYDLRQTSKPLMTLRGHRKAVSYVCWVGDELVSASTDNSLKLWNVKSQNSQDACVRTFSGHTNEKNFVGLSANSDGYIACGSEDNVLHVYAKSSSVPVARYSFADKTSQSIPGRRDKGGFISAVNWSPDSEHILAASSRGQLKILALTKNA